MKYDLKKIMLNAWKNYRRYNISFAEALHRAWLSAKAEEINAERIKRSKEAADVTEDTNTFGTQFFSNDNGFIQSCFARH